MHYYYRNEKSIDASIRKVDSQVEFFEYMLVLQVCFDYKVYFH